ncbi:hypothetical protein BJ944DRAFT_282074 [Cunninghamella echinulata]|nr:hypothetical protein BJ944DRAFT_282074 [Cunninghamella echinulata]
MVSDRLITSANWVRNELLVRLAHRIRDFQQLPFIIGTNPNIEWPYRLYWGAFETLRKQPVIKTNQDNIKFCHLLEELLEDGQHVLPRMALGVSECATHYQTKDHVLDGFLNRMVRSRISRRLLAEQHVALTKACCGSDQDQMAIHGSNRSKPLQVGIFNSECSATAIFNQAKTLVTKQLSSFSHLPPIQLYIQGNDDITFAYIPEQLEHILYEILNNSMKCTIQHHQRQQKGMNNLPPIQVTICSNKTDIFFRVSDCAGGIPSTKYEKLWSYQERAASGDFDDFQVIHKMPVTMAERMKLEQQSRNENNNNNSIGLIMSRIFAEYFGGELQVMTLESYGTDVYVRIPRLGSHTENLGIDLKHRQQQLQQQQHNNKHQHHHHHHHHVKIHHQQHQQQHKQVSHSTIDITSDMDIKTKHHVGHQSLEPNKEGWASSSMVLS